MDKYPPWLEKQASSSSSSLSPGELERYQQQYACIRRLCGAYEAEPDNTSKIMELLQEVSNHSGLLQATVSSSAQLWPHLELGTCCCLVVSLKIVWQSLQGARCLTTRLDCLCLQMQACGEPPAEIVEEMSAAIAADLPADAAAAGGGAGGLGFDSADLEGLGELPPEFRNCPVQ